MYCVRLDATVVVFQGNRSNELGLPVDVLIEVIHPETALQPSRFEYLSLAHMIEERGLGFPTNRSVDTLSSGDVLSHPVSTWFVYRLLCV